MTETVLMASAAIILASVAAVAATGAVWCVASTAAEWNRRYRIRGLTCPQIRYIRRVSARFQARNAKEGT